MTKEPKRMSEEPSALGSSVAAFRERGPSDARLAALAERLGAAGAPVDFHPKLPAREPEPPPSAEPSPPPAKGRWRPRFLLPVLLVAGTGMVAWLVARQRGPAPGTDETRSVVMASSPSAPAAPADGHADETSSTPAVPTAQSGIRNPQLAPPSAATSTTAPPDTAPEPAAPEARGAAPAPSGARGELAQPSVSANARTEEDVRRKPRPPSARELAQSDSRAGGPLANNTVVTSELELLKQARSALAADPAQAFALTERCRAQYPNGDLAQEREYIAISALVRLGRSSEAASRASLFRMHYPSSAYLPRLARLLGEP